MKLLPGLVGTSLACSKYANDFVELTSTMGSTSIATKLINMPENVALALDLVFKYLMGDPSQMLMDGFINVGGFGNEEPEEPEENDKDLAGIFLSTLLNPTDNTNRYLQYEFTRTKLDGANSEGDDVVADYCDKGWRKLNGSQCWRHFDERMARTGAKQLCFQKNAELVKPATAADNLVLASYVWDNEIDSCLWLGVNDLREEGAFMFDNSNVHVDHMPFSKHSRANNEYRNHVIYQPSANYSPKRDRWFMADGDVKRCSAVCVKDVGDRVRKPAAVINPLEKVNRFLSLGELDAYYEVVRKKTKNGEEVCDAGFEQVGNSCLMYRPGQLHKRTHKIECLKLGATLFAPMDEGEQEEMLGYLDTQNAEEGTRVWIGFNDGKVEGTYVLDNSKGAILMPWENFKLDDNENTEEAGSLVMDYDTGLWIRVDSYQNDTAVCSKPLLPA